MTNNKYQITNGKYCGLLVLSLSDLRRDVSTLNLTGSSAGDRFNKVNDFWTFEIGERCAAMGNQSSFGRFASKHHCGGYFFAKNSILNAERDRFCHRRVSEQHFINLA